MPNIPKEFRVRMQGSADIQIGKSGISPGLLDQVTRLLKQYRLIKIRVLRNAPDPKEIDPIAEQIAQSTGSRVGITRGRCFILYKGNWRGRLSKSLATSRSKPPK